MPGRHDALTRKLALAALTAGDHLPKAQRRAAFVRTGELFGFVAREHLGAGAAEALPAPLAAFVEKIATAPASIVREDVTALVAQGYAEEALLELVTAAAVGAGFGRLEFALAALSRKA